MNKQEREKDKQDDALDMDLHRFVARIPGPLMPILKQVAWVTQVSVNTLISDLLISRILDLYKSHLEGIRASEQRQKELDDFLREKANRIREEKGITGKIDDPLAKPRPFFPDIDESILSQYETLSKNMEQDFLTGTYFSRMDEHHMTNLVDLFADYLVWREEKARGPGK